MESFFFFFFQKLFVLIKRKAYNAARKYSMRYSYKKNDVHLGASGASSESAGVLQTLMISSAHLQPPDLVQMQLETAVHLPNQITVIQNDAHFIGFRPSESLHQLLVAPLEELFIREVGDVFCWTFWRLGSRLCL